VVDEAFPGEEATIAVVALAPGSRDVRIVPTDERLGRDDPADGGAFRITADSDAGAVLAIARARSSPIAVPPGDRVTRVGAGWVCADAGLAWIPAGEASLTVALVPSGASYGISIRAMAREGISSALDVARAEAVGRALGPFHSGQRPDRPRSAPRPFEGDLGVTAAIDALVREPTGRGAHSRLVAIERAFVAWRHRLAGHAARTTLVHGGAVPDMFVIGEDAALPIASARRGLGEPAEDVATLAVALLAEGVADRASWLDGYLPLWRALWSSYLTASGDYALLDVAPPFLAWRALAVASGLVTSPPTLRVASTLIDFSERWLDARTFDPDDVAAWLGA
jgi:hypothetical protein